MGRASKAAKYELSSLLTPAISSAADLANAGAAICSWSELGQTMYPQYDRNQSDYLSGPRQPGFPARVQLTDEHFLPCPLIVLAEAA